MKEKLRFFTAGIFIGVSELLPGISGATVALMFGVYEKILNFLSKFKDLNLMIPLFVGMLFSVFVFSSTINFLYENHTNAFNLFIGILMIGYGLFLLVNTYLEEQTNKGIIFYHPSNKLPANNHRCIKINCKNLIPSAIRHSHK